MKFSHNKKIVTIESYLTRLYEIFDAMVGLVLAPVVNGLASLDAFIKIEILGFRTEVRFSNFHEFRFQMEFPREEDLAGQTQLV